MTDDPIANMRSRMERCRRLARLTTDERMNDALRQMADEIEADAKRLEQERRSAAGSSAS
jgi:hypothetical protein